MKKAKLSDNLLEFIMAGMSTFTLVNKTTSNRMTFQVNKIKEHKKHSKNDPDIWFVKYMDGSDNIISYGYIGYFMYDKGNIVFRSSRKAKYKSDHKSVKVFSWLMQNVISLPQTVEFWHEGRCGRCNRKLTVPESIDTGYGPECWKMIGAKRQWDAMNNIADDIIFNMEID